MSSSSVFLSMLQSLTNAKKVWKMPFSKLCSDGAFIAWRKAISVMNNCVNYYVFRGQSYSTKLIFTTIWMFIKFFAIKLGHCKVVTIFFSYLKLSCSKVRIVKTKFVRIDWSSGVNFINVLCICAAFTRTNPNSVKRYWQLNWIFTLSGSACVEDVRRTLMKLSPGAWCDYISLVSFPKGYRVCRGFRLMKRDDYFWVIFDHF